MYSLFVFIECACKKILSNDELVQIVLQTGTSLGLDMLLCNIYFNTYIDVDTC